VERNWRRLAHLLCVSWDRIAPWIHGIPVHQVLRHLVPDMPESRVQELHDFMVEAESTDTADVVPLPAALTVLDLLATSRWAVVASGGLRLAGHRVAPSLFAVPADRCAAEWCCRYACAATLSEWTDASRRGRPILGNDGHSRAAR
jgi:hypothetical protein